MAAPTLFFSRRKLARFELASMLFGFALVPLVWRMTGEEGFHKLHEAYIFYAFGPYGPRGVVLVFGLLLGLAGVAALLRSAGDLAAATIRLDGLRVVGLLSSRTIPWRHLVSVALTHAQWKGRTIRTLVIKSTRLPGES